MWIPLLLFAASSTAFGQSVELKPPGFGLPHVRPDRTVEFRLDAPGARKVALQGEWMPSGASLAMKRQPGGIWSLIVGPLPPDLYLYGFEVDGIRIADPSNRLLKTGYPGISSLVEVPGLPLLSARNVPHGALHIHHYRSRVTNSMRRLHVYTPPGYEDSGTQNHPVLVLLHGSWDDDSAWSQVGRAGTMMDNLLAAGIVPAMILVMPDGHPYPSFDVSTRPGNLEWLRRDLGEEILPLLERSYRVARHRNRRAIAGLSMGGAQALHLGLTMDQFGTVGAFSAPGDIPKGRTFAEALRDANNSGRNVPMLWLACGKDDPFFGEAQQVHTLLSGRGIPHTWRETEGTHSWMVWRRHFEEFVKLLFPQQAR